MMTSVCCTLDHLCPGESTRICLSLRLRQSAGRAKELWALYARGALRLVRMRDPLEPRGDRARGISEARRRQFWRLRRFHGWSHGHVRDELTTYAGQLEVTERAGNYLLYELALGAQWSWGDVRVGVEYGNTDPAIGNTRVVLAFGVNTFDMPR